MAKYVWLLCSLGMADGSYRHSTFAYFITIQVLLAGLLLRD